MRKVNVGEFLNVTQITLSDTADDMWQRLIDVASEEDTEVEFDFEGVYLDRPWCSTGFNRLMENERVHLTVYYDEVLKDTIDIMCAFKGVKQNRVKNIETAVEKVAPKINKEVEILYNRFKENFNIENGKATIVLSDYISQIGTTDTVEALRKAVEDFSREQGVTDFTFYTEFIGIETHLINTIALMVVELKQHSINLEIKSDDEEIQSLLDTAVNLQKRVGLTERGKIDVITEVLTKNCVGMLSTYKETKRKDLFGREGDGEVVVSRPAIFRGIQIENNTFYLVIDEYNGRNFVTKLDYALDNDGDEHTGIKFERKRIHINEIGIEDEFIGSRYLFELPVQECIEDSITVYTTTEDTIETEEILFPEFLKKVFTDFGVAFDTSKLDQSIERSKERLGV